MQDWQDALLVYSTESGKIKPEPKEQARSVSSDGVCMPAIHGNQSSNAAVHSGRKLGLCSKHLVDTVSHSPYRSKVDKLMEFNAMLSVRFHNGSV